MKSKFPLLIFTYNNDDANDLIEPYLSVNSICKSCNIERSFDNCQKCKAWLMPPRPWYDYKLSTKFMLPLKDGGHAIQTFVDKVDWGPTGCAFDIACLDMSSHFEDVVNGKAYDPKVTDWIKDTGVDPKMGWVSTKYAIQHTNFYSWLYITPEGDFHGLSEFADEFNYNTTEYDYARNFKTDVVDKFSPSTHVTAAILYARN